MIIEFYLHRLPTDFVIFNLFDIGVWSVDIIYEIFLRG